MAKLFVHAYKVTLALHPHADQNVPSVQNAPKMRLVTIKNAGTHALEHAGLVPNVLLSITIPSAAAQQDTLVILSYAANQL